MNRRTEYVKGYGYVTGDGILDSVVQGLKTLVASKAVGDAASEALKAGAKSAGDKLGTKIIERAFKGNPRNSPRSNASNDSIPNNLLKEIYGNSLFGKKQSGKGLCRI